MQQMKIPNIGCFYLYKGRLVRVLRISSPVKIQRVEVIEGEFNPFWINFSDLDDIYI